MIRFTTLGLLFLLTACGSTDDNKPRTREAFCQQWAAQACSSAVVSACQAASAETCRLSQQTFCANLVPETFSDAAGDACLAAVGAAYADADLTGPELDTVLELGPPCNRIVNGPAKLGETCTVSGDCEGSAGYECVIKGGQSQGTCQIPTVVGAGLRCAAPQQVCMADFYCDDSNCIAAKPVGESCANDEECGSSGWCAADGLCAVRLAVSEPCVNSNECLSGLCFTFAADDRTCTDRLRLTRSEPICADLR